MARKRVTIEQWIEEALSDVDKGKPCSALSLVHVKGVGQEEVHTKPLSGTQNPKALAEFFIARATGFAQDLAGIQTFRLLAFYGSTEPQGAFPFTVAEGELTGGGETPFAKHEPTQTGLIGQLMKHNEQTMAMALDLAKTMAVSAVQREAAMRQEVNEAQLIVRDVIFNMRKEAHEWRLKELEFQRSSDERRMLGKALPSIINHLTGREAIPQDFADSELLDAMAMRIKPEMLQQLIGMGIITQEQGTMLAARFAQAIEQRKKEIEALKMVPPEDKETIQ